MDAQVLIPKKKVSAKKDAIMQQLFDSDSESDPSDRAASPPPSLSPSPPPPTPTPTPEDDNVTRQHQRTALSLALKRRHDIATTVLDDSTCHRILLTDITCWTMDVEVFESIKASVSHLSLKHDLCWSLLERRLMDERYRESPQQISKSQCRRMLEKKLPPVRKAIVKRKKHTK